MAKLNKTILKKLIKECLVEILSEAAVSGNSKTIVESKKSAPRSDREFLAATRRKKKPAPKVDVSQITNDPVMAAIFEDTARTTLVEQAANETRTPTVGGVQSGSPKMEHISGNLDDVFGDAAGKWANIAFPTENSKK